VTLVAFGRKLPRLFPGLLEAGTHGVYFQKKEWVASPPIGYVSFINTFPYDFKKSFLVKVN
jgi:hypothetical protein